MKRVLAYGLQTVSNANILQDRSDQAWEALLQVLIELQGIAFVTANPPKSTNTSVHHIRLIQILLKPSERLPNRSR